MSTGSRLDRSAITPLRALQAEVEEGCRLLAVDTASYRDGAEDRVMEILTGARDLSSGSDELTGRADSWPTLYSLSSARANLLQPLALEGSGTALDIGAGCGGLTRYLGESVATVDALEPMLARARAARARTRDLPGVEVFVGDIRSVPPEPAYDLVTAVGVLEYLAGGDPDPAPYVAFLSSAGKLLNPGGTLAIATENRIGVKYLAGAAEDHTGRRFDSLEGYPGGGPARTFSRLELESMMLAAGLRPIFLGAFPDYKLTRTLIADELFGVDPELATALVTFPSPDRAGPGTRAIDEGALWRTVVEAGLGPQLSNSFLVLASSGTESRLWPAGRLAAYYQDSRRSSLAVEAVVERRGAETVLHRRFISPAPGGDDSSSSRSSPPDGVRLLLKDTVRTPGRSLLELLARCGAEELAHWMDAWRKALDELLAEQPAEGLFDALPHNFIVTPDGALRLVDSKWLLSGATRSDILARCALVTGRLLEARRLPPHWVEPTREGIVRRLGGLLGLDPEGSWLEEALEREARFQAVVTSFSPDPGDPGARRHLIRLILDGDLAQAPGPPKIEAAQLARLAAALAEQVEVNRQLLGSTSWRLTAPLRGLTERARRSVRRAKSAPTGRPGDGPGGSGEGEGSVERVPSEPRNLGGGLQGTSRKR